MIQSTINNLLRLTLIFSIIFFYGCDSKKNKKKIQDNNITKNEEVKNNEDNTNPADLEASLASFIESTADLESTDDSKVLVTFSASDELSMGYSNYLIGLFQVTFEGDWDDKTPQNLFIRKDRNDSTIIDLKDIKPDIYLFGGHTLLPQGNITKVTVTFIPELTKVTTLLDNSKPTMILDSLGLTLYSDTFDASTMPPMRQNKFYQVSHDLTTPITVSDNMHLSIAIDKNLSYTAFKGGETGLFVPSIELKHKINESSFSMIVEDQNAHISMVENTWILMNKLRDRIGTFLVDKNNATLYKNNFELDATADLETSDNFYHITLTGEMDIQSDLFTVQKAYFYDLTDESVKSLFSGHIVDNKKLGVETKLATEPSHAFHLQDNPSDNLTRTFDASAILGLDNPQTETTTMVDHFHLANLSLTQAHPRLAIDIEAKQLTFIPGAIDLKQMNDDLAESGGGSNSVADSEDKIAIPVLASAVIKSIETFDSSTMVPTLWLSDNVETFTLMINGSGDFFYGEMQHFDDVTTFLTELNNKMLESDSTDSADTNTDVNNDADNTKTFKYAIKAILADGSYSDNVFTVDKHIKVILDFHHEDLQRENYKALIDSLLSQNTEAKNGLSGGAIAGIVLGSIAGAIVAPYVAILGGALVAAGGVAGGALLVLSSLPLERLSALVFTSPAIAWDKTFGWVLNKTRGWKSFRTAYLEKFNPFFKDGLNKLITNLEYESRYESSTDTAEADKELKAKIKILIDGSANLPLAKSATLGLEGELSRERINSLKQLGIAAPSVDEVFNYVKTQADIRLKNNSNFVFKTGKATPY